MEEPQGLASSASPKASAACSVSTFVGLWLLRCNDLVARIGPSNASASKVVDMIPRYTPAEFEALWSSVTRYQTWLEVELAACEAMEHENLVPAGTAAAIRSKNIALDPARIDEIEKTTRH